MKLFDLTHTLSPQMPVYPGTEPPILTTGCSIDEDGFLEKKINLYSHTGTHIDAPAHLIKGAKTLDMLPIDHFYGKAFLLVAAEIDNRKIGINLLEPHRDTIRQADFLLIYTGWSHHWGDETYFSDYPVLSLEAADWLSRFGLKGVGFDTISADQADTQDYPVHKAFLQNDTIIVENLTNLENLFSDQFILACFPLKFEEADGSPVRAVALLE